MTAIYRTPAGQQKVESGYREILARWPVPHRSLRVPTRAGETFVIASGPAHAPALALLHGSASNSSMWMGDVAAWAEHFRVLAIDQLGEPGLSAARRLPLDSEEPALWLCDVLAGLGVARTSVVGLSLGGWLATDFATRFPERVERLVLLCPGGIGRQREAFLLRALPLLLLGRFGRRRVLSLLDGPAQAQRGAAKMPPEYAEFLTSIFQHFRPRRDALPRFSDESLRRLTMPLLGVLGGHDLLLDSADTRRRLAASAPHAQIAWLPDAGHSLTQQTARVLEFLTAEASV